MTPELIAQMNLDKSLAFYKDRFADASDFTFVFVGSFDLPTIKPLVERYLGSLPSLRRKEAGRDVGIRPPPASSRRRSTKGSTPKSQVGRRVQRSVPEQPENRVIVRAMANTLGGNLQRVLREDLGGTYGVSVVARFTKRPIEEYRLTISFACDPARTQDLVKTLFEVIDDFKTTGPGAGAGRRRASGAAAGSRNQQPAERLPAESAGVRVSVRRAGAGPVVAPRALRSADGAAAA